MRLASLLAAGVVLLGLAPLSFAGSATISIDGKANVYAAGRAAPFGGGVMPASVRFAAGSGKVLTLSGTSGGVLCIAGAVPLGADGGDCLGYKETHIDSYKGISGIRHKTRAMFLVGVFTTDAEPADPAPAILDFTGNDAFTTLAPQINQAFFLGDGMTGTGSGTRQQFQVPAAATRLWLGFADGLYFFGAPGGYENNSGSLSATVEIAGADISTGGPPAGGEITGAAFSLPGTSNIYAAGRGTAFSGTLPPFIRIPSGSSRSFTFSSMTGLVSCCGGSPDTGPDGTAAGATNINPYRGISGIRNDRRQQFVVGVFLDDTEPADPPPPSLNFTDNMAFSTLSPQLRQVFFIGDGLTGTGNGTQQAFTAPATATRLFLGYADGWSFSGNPGYYEDNLGSVSGSFSLGTGGGSGCSYSILPTTASYDYRGGTGTVQITAPITCSWFSNTNAGWLKITLTDRGSGAGTLHYSVEQNDSGLTRVGTLTIAGNTFTVTQTASSTCTYSLGMDKLTVPIDAGAYVLQIRTAPSCPWTAASTVPWITMTASSGTGEGFARYTVSANLGGPPRVGTIVAAGQTFRLTQSGTLNTCSYSLSATSVPVKAAGGTGRITVYAPEPCSWTARSNAAWITLLSSATGAFVADVQYRVDANASSASRTGTMTIAGQEVVFTQEAAASASIVEITAVMNDADYTPAFAPGSVVLILGKNLSSSKKQVESGAWPATLDGVSVEVLDGGRTLLAPIYSVSPDYIFAQLPFGVSSSVDLRVSAPAGKSALKNLAIAPRSPRLYTYDGSGTSHAWAYHPDDTEVTPAAPAKPGEDVLLLGSGFGAVTPAASAGQPGINPFTGAEPNRVSDTVTVEIEGISVRPRYAILDFILIGAYIVVFPVPDQVTSRSPSVVVRVGAAASQAGVTLPVEPKSGGTACTYSLSPTSADMAAAGGSGVVAVTADAGCAWTATSAVSWVKITEGASGTASGSVRYSVDANTAAARVATLTIAGRAFTITQQASGSGSVGCAVTLLPSSLTMPAEGGAGAVLVSAESACAWSASTPAPWISITAPSSGLGDALVQYSVAPNVQATSRTALVSVNGLTQSLQQSGTSSSLRAPAVLAGGLVNPADWKEALAPGGVISILGTDLALAEVEATAVPLPDTLGGVSVELRAGANRWLAPLLLVAPGEIRAQLPFDLPSEVAVVVKTDRGNTPETALKLTRTAPRVFTSSGQGTGEATAIHADGRAVLEDLPAGGNETVSLFLTGLGPVSPAAPAGQAGGDNGAGGPRNAATETVELRLDGNSAEVVFAGLAPGRTGLYRVDFKVPANPPRGLVPLVVKAGDAESQANVFLSLGPEMRSRASAEVGPDGGTVGDSDVRLVIPAGALQRMASIAVNAATAGAPAFSITGLPAGTTGNLTLSFSRPISARTSSGDFVLVQDADGGSTILDPAIDGSRVTVVVPLGATSSLTSATRRVAADGSMVELLLLILYIEGASVDSKKGLVRMYAPWENFQPDNPAEAALFRTELQRRADVFELAYSGLILKGVSPLPDRFFPIQVRLVNQYAPAGPIAGEYHGEIRRSRSRSGMLIHWFATEMYSLKPGSKQPDQDESLPDAAHLAMHYLLYANLPPSPGNLQNSRDPWLWFDEALATWFEREMGGGIGTMRLPPAMFSQFLFGAVSAGSSLGPLPPLVFDFLKNTVFPSPQGLAWPGPRTFAAERWSGYARFYGQAAAMFVDHIDAKLAKDQPEWLGKFITARKSAGEKGLEPVGFLRDVFFPDMGLDLNAYWREFCIGFGVGQLYADLDKESNTLFRAYLQLFGGQAGIRIGDGAISKLRKDEFAMGDYGLAYYFLETPDQMGPQGRAAVGVRSNTGALAQLASCSEPAPCFSQLFTPSDFYDVAAASTPELRKQTWWPALVIQPASDVPVGEREKVRIRIEASPTLAAERMVRSRRLFCNLKAKFTCLGPYCPEGLGFETWLPEGSHWSCPGGACLFHYAPRPGESNLGYVQFADGAISEAKAVTTYSFLDRPATTSLTVKKLPLTKIYASTEDGDWEAARFLVEGDAVAAFVSGMTFKYVDKDKNVSSIKSVSFDISSTLVCGLDLIPMRVD